MDTSPDGNSKRMIATTIGVVALLGLFCCGGPTVFYFVVKNSVASWIESATTPQQFTANELFDWHSANRPSQPFVLHDKTRDKVDLVGTILEANSGPNLRIASMSENHRVKLEDLEAHQQERYEDWGQFQLVFRGEQANQEVICWFEDAEPPSVSVGQRVVVRGRIASVESGTIEKDGFAMNLTNCRVLSE
jgi:hypothetical protein